MTRHPPRDAKFDALRATGTLNRRAAQIDDPLFGTHDFFDPRDLVQVKYEMLRRVEIDGQAVAPTAAAFQLSRPSFYATQRAFQQRGLAGLFPKKRGPHGGHKLTGEIVAFLRMTRTQDPALRASEARATRRRSLWHHGASPYDPTDAGAPGKKRPR